MLKVYLLSVFKVNEDFFRFEDEKGVCQFILLGKETDEVLNWINKTFNSFLLWDFPEDWIDTLN